MHDCDERIDAINHLDPIGRFQSMGPPLKKPAEEKAICLRPRFVSSLIPGNWWIFGFPKSTVGTCPNQCMCVCVEKGCTHEMSWNGGNYDDKPLECGGTLCSDRPKYSKYVCV